MKLSLRSWGAWLSIIIMSFCCVRPLFAGSAGLADPNAGLLPPYGLAVSSDAPGMKLDGVLYMEFYNVTKYQNNYFPEGLEGVDRIADIRVVLRLAKGNLDPVTFYHEIEGAPYIDLPSIQQAVIEGGMLEKDILDAFLIEDKASPAEIKIKSIIINEGWETPTALTGKEEDKFYVYDYEGEGAQCSEKFTAEICCETLQIGYKDHCISITEGGSDIVIMDIQLAVK